MTPLCIYSVCVMPCCLFFFPLQISSIMKEAGIHSVTVQVEKESYFYHMSGLGSALDQSLPISFTPSKVRFTAPASVV